MEWDRNPLKSFHWMVLPEIRAAASCRSAAHLGRGPVITRQPVSVLTPAVTRFHVTPPPLSRRIKAKTEDTLFSGCASSAASLRGDRGESGEFNQRAAERRGNFDCSLEKGVIKVSTEPLPVSGCLHLFCQTVETSHL